MRNGFSYDQKWEAVVLLPAYAGLTVHLSTDVLQQYRIQLHHSANAVPVLEDQYSINRYSYSVRQRRGGLSTLLAVHEHEERCHHRQVRIPVAGGMRCTYAQARPDPIY